MKTKTIELYEFEELPANIQAKVLDNERHINVEDDFWSEFILEEWEQKLEGMGFNNPSIAYRGFWSQGDGASFTCDSIDIRKFLASQKKKTQFKKFILCVTEGTIDFWAKVYRSDHHYCHEYTVSIDTDLNVYDNAPESDFISMQGKIEELLKEVVRDLSKQIYKELEESYDNLVTDEAVKDTILANGYTFTIDGDMENA